MRVTLGVVTGAANSKEFKFVLYSGFCHVHEEAEGKKGYRCCYNMISSVKQFLNTKFDIIL